MAALRLAGDERGIAAAHKHRQGLPRAHVSSFFASHLR
jgi:hypothetical protein